MEQKKLRNRFTLPNELYILGLSPGAIAVYSYLLRLEDRRTFQCYPSYRAIGKAVSMSENTVRKYVTELKEKRLIETEPTMVLAKDGNMRNGNLRYTILPIQEAVELYNEQQMAQLELDAAKAKPAKKLGAAV